VPLPANLFSCQLTSPRMMSKLACSIGKSPIRLAILDSGIDESNIDLMGKVDYKRDILYNTTSVQDTNGHGTNCAGIAFRYLQQNVTMQIYKILNANGEGRAWDMLKAIDAAVINGSKIISISVAGYQPGRAGDTPLGIAIENAEKNNVLIVAAAGNGTLINGELAGLNIDEDQNHVVPAGEQYKNILSVGSLRGCTNLTTASSFSNWGQTQVDIYTYGENILTWNHLGQVVNVSGTSYSNILAACVASELWSNIPSANRSYVSLKAAMLNSADYEPSLATKCTSHGILNAPNALCLLLNGCAVLPVELTSFSVRQDGDNVRLDWTVESEKQMNSYEIERSSDGITFEQIDRQKAKAISQHAMTYSFQDKTPQYGTNYYRLKMVESNGAFTYSKTVSVGMYAKSGLKAYPNPFSNVLEVEWQGIKMQKSVNLKLMDIAGRLVWSSEVQNTEGGINHYQLPIQKLSSGVYWLRLDNQPIQKLIKQ
jgi:hypothetical protein